MKQRAISDGTFRPNFRSLAVAAREATRGLRMTSLALADVGIRFRTPIHRSGDTACPRSPKMHEV
ncbi:hypothetical protein OB2597_13743 [Pseudooceanicola batsensis HTCC2597]|uniref:Uncharacterized protein n=1 Tax=Pseudooceanicola batsensis (strain ATCC BAA-863 / DSM 15984 / KCTC 12145 / HTCC2597) TaxID=252305 RepID=A3TYH7_PSEBH|nr:hypothetical protein [Pseudooceanicola batsensis]EAQ03211.1 hypothetical protein OB2597_13743 [Pseudooceanicola batsensis HTCC2597]